MKRRRGLTLLEVIFALAILTIAILGILGTMLANIRVTEQTRKSDIASNAARAMIDRIRATPFDNIGITFGAPNNTFFVAGLPPRPGAQPHGVIHFSQPPPPDPDPRMVSEGGAYQDTPIAGNLLNVRIRVFFSRVRVDPNATAPPSDEEGVVTLYTVIYTDSP